MLAAHLPSRHLLFVTPAMNYETRAQTYFQSAPPSYSVEEVGSNGIRMEFFERTT